jgi:hypothetical protein
VDASPAEVPDPLSELYLDALSGRTVSPSALCVACTRVLPVQDASVVSVISHGPLELAGASDGAAAALVELQLGAGDGPTLEALARGGPVLLGDQGRGVGATRWPLLAAAHPEVMAGAVYALPLQRGAIRLGVLTLRRPDTTPLAATEFAAVVDAAETVTTVLLLDGVAAASGTPREHGAWPHGNPLTAEVHQATGMVLAQLDVGAREAYLRLRAHAVAEGLPLSEVAHAVLTRTLRFSPEVDQPRTDDP